MPGGGEGDVGDYDDGVGDFCVSYDCRPGGGPPALPTPLRDALICTRICWVLTIPVYLFVLLDIQPVMHFDVNNLETRVMPLPAGGSPLWWQDDCGGCVKAHCFTRGFVPTVAAHTRKYEWSEVIRVDDGVYYRFHALVLQPGSTGAVTWEFDRPVHFRAFTDVPSFDEWVNNLHAHRVDLPIAPSQRAAAWDAVPIRLIDTHVRLVWFTLRGEAAAVGRIKYALHVGALDVNGVAAHLTLEQAVLLPPHGMSGCILEGPSVNPKHPLSDHVRVDAVSTRFVMLVMRLWGCPEISAAIVFLIPALLTLALAAGRWSGRITDVPYVLAEGAFGPVRITGRPDASRRATHAHRE